MNREALYTINTRHIPFMTANIAWHAWVGWYSSGGWKIQSSVGWWSDCQPSLILALYLSICLPEPRVLWCFDIVTVCVNDHHVTKYSLAQSTNCVYELVNVDLLFKMIWLAKITWELLYLSRLHHLLWLCMWMKENYMIFRLFKVDFQESDF